MKKLYSLLLVLGLTLGAFAQDQSIVLSGETINLNPAQSGNVQFTVEGYSYIDWVTFSMKFDPSVLEYEGAVFHANIPTATVNQDEVAQGNLGFNLSGFLSPGPSVPDGEVLMTLSFKAIGFDGNSSTIVVHDSPLGIGGISGVSGVTVSAKVNGVVNIGTPNSIQELGKASMLNAYPNPSSDMVTLTRSQNANDESLRIIDIRGSLVEAFIMTSDVLRINVSDYPAGLYFITISNGLDLNTVRLVVN